jgi:uncharacterized membrane protein
VRVAAAVALLASGLLAGALGFGWANVAPTFSTVPLDVHLTFRVALFARNGVIMPALMVASFAATVWLAVTTRGRARAGAVAAAGLTAATFLVTRFGNVPMNDEMRRWLAGTVAPDYEERLALWEFYNDIRVATAVLAFGLLVAVVTVVRAPEAVRTAR